MDSSRIKRKLKILLISMAVVFVLLLVFRAGIERTLLFYPSHDNPDGALDKWVINGEVIGFSRMVASPKNVWLVFHGNAGQAADRSYMLDHFAPDDAAFIMEYPGYGKRAGVPSKRSFNAAAEEAYMDLRKRFPTTPICVASESIGSGPACYLATLEKPPDKLVLIVPFDSLGSVAREHFARPIVWALLQQNWDNITALKNYKGRVDIFAARADTIIPPRHAQALADSIPTSTFTLIDGGHNDWSDDPRVKIRNP
jgi:uncharacterized protein